jgi:hypothetical protein
MGFPLIAVTGATPPFHQALNQGLLANPMFSFWLNRDPSATFGGELVLGGMDDSHYTGEHTWCAGLVVFAFSVSIVLSCSTACSYID